MWILFLDAGGAVAHGHKLDATTGFGGHLDDGDVFARAEGVGDLDRDGVPDIAVGAAGDDDGGTDRGAVWLLAMNRDGTVKSHQKISSLIGNFSGDLDDQDYFGASIARLGDLDGDGFQDLAVGSWDDDGGPNRGALWMLFLGQERARRSGAPTGSSTVTLPLSKQPRCLYAQPRLVLDGGRHVAPGSIPILWLTPTRPQPRGRPERAQVIRFVGAPVLDGRASFPLETRATGSIDTFECTGAFLTPQLQLLPADARIMDPAPGLPR